MRRPVLALLAALVALVAMPTAASAETGELVPLIVNYTSGGLSVLEVPASRVAATEARLEADPEVIEVERDSIVHADRTPTDPLWSQQTGARTVRAPEAWDRTTGDPSVIVAVVDTGVSSHPDLAGVLLAGRDFVAGDLDATDENGHGTSVAGIVAAQADNGIGIAGYCWQCRVLPVRVLGTDGSGRTSDVAAGIRWAADNGADVINLSLSGPTASFAVLSAVSYAKGKGIVVIAAAGNQEVAGDDLTVPQYPAAMEGVVGVVATTSGDAAYSWTYRGASWTDVAAPGCNPSLTNAGGTRLSFCGTSSASPVVAGIVALALSAFPAADGPTVEAALLASSVPIGGGLVGSGRVDAAALLARLGPLVPAAPVVSRIGGDDPVATGVAVSARVRSAAPAVVLARVDDFADALAAGPLAAKVGGPVLLTSSASLDAPVAEEIARLGATTAYLIGGTAVLAPAVEEQLQARGVAVLRLSGPDRYATAGEVAKVVGGTSVYLASGTSWADAVGASALAARQSSPILLTRRDDLPSATVAVLSILRPTSVIVVGGEGVVAESVRTAASAATRISGPDRFATSIAVADATLAAGANPARTWLATALDWRDALVAGPAAASQGGVLLLVNGATVSGSPAETWLAARASAIRTLVVVGGETWVSTSSVTTLSSLFG